MDAQLSMLHGDEVWRTTNIVALQEPYLDPRTHLTRTLPSWRVVYPTTHGQDGTGRTRSILFIRKTISTNDWAQVPIPSPDVTALRLCTSAGWILLINMYNPCDNNAPIPLVEKVLHDFRGRGHVILLGDFNRHHPSWDEMRNAHLFTNANLDLAEPLLELVGRFDLEMTLAKGTPTLQSTLSKNYTRPDNVFMSRQLAQALVSCQTVPDARPTHTDHLPIRTSLELTVDKPLSCERWDWHKADWEKFNEALELELANSG